MLSDLFEKKYEDKAYVIRRLYDECFPSSLILGVYAEDAFCGLAEIYGYRAPFLKASTGYRLAKKYWGKGSQRKRSVCWCDTFCSIRTFGSLPPAR